ncbi:uncharacterized protein TNCV_2195181 [Trichonephila clavipes]|uniref:DUF7041 domain-containing protein n=1 Tax=Trichonephila clavipes TaxID=2585209 RepID=A0A8X6SB31_TRICX|nr:uncharacterized protein TNCV_2195181 [Trichonephila clavipes]
MATPETAAVVIPPFIQRDPALWFYMIESTFELASPKPITESKTKYNYAVSHLPPDIATVVRDVIIQPDISDPYSELKAKIIERCSENKTQEIRRLLAGESLGDRKPSELLRIMKRRAENYNIDDSLLFELFNQAMPVPVQTILASISPITSDKASEVADRILAISPHAINAVSASGASPSSVTDRRSSTDMFLWMKLCARKLQTFVDIVVNFGTTTTFVESVRIPVQVSSAGTTFVFKLTPRNAFRPAPLRKSRLWESRGGGLFLWIYFSSSIHQGP